MKHAWQPVASVAISTMPPSTRSRASDDDTVLMTAYSVSFSRRTRASASPPWVDAETVTSAHRNRASTDDTCAHRTSQRGERCVNPHCTNLYEPDTVAL